MGKPTTTTSKTLNQAYGLNPAQSSRQSLRPQPAVLTMQWRHLGGSGGLQPPQGFMMLIFLPVNHTFETVLLLQYVKQTETTHKDY